MGSRLKQFLKQYRMRSIGVKQLQKARIRDIEDSIFRNLSLSFVMYLKSG